MSDQLKIIALPSWPVRAAVSLLPVALAFILCWAAVKWFVGDTIAEYGPRMEANQIENARAAVSLAPADPLAHWTLGKLEQKDFSDEAQREAIRHFEEAAALSPNDYRLWMDLGRARSQVGDTAGGEGALRRAVELAPVYGEPRWYLGNLLLRAGRTEEAFAELRRAADADARLRPQVFNMAWHVYGANSQTLARVVGDSPAARAELARYLMDQQKIDEALKVWATLNVAEQKQQSDVGQALLKSLLAAGRFRDALKLNETVAPQGAASIGPEQFVNASFESDPSSATVFDWQVRSTTQEQVGIDPRAGHQGARSLRIVFNAPSKLDFNTVSQLVVVEPAATYQFQCYVRTENLKSVNTPFIEIIDGTNGAQLAASAPVPVGQSDWQAVKIDFKTSPKTEAVTVRINRAPCTADTVCPIFGTIWYDDFNLQRTGGNT